MAEIGNQIWSGRIVDAHYTNPEHDTVEILYRQVHPDELLAQMQILRKSFILKVILKNIKLRLELYLTML